MTDANAFLAGEPIGKLLLKFSIPCVLSVLVSALYNIVDQIFIGWSVGYLGNAAINIVFPFTLIALAVGILIGDGSAALLSLSQGSGDRQTSHRCIGNGIVLSITTGIVLTVIGFLFTGKLLKLFGVTEASYGYAWDYMRIILIGIPFYVFSSGMDVLAFICTIGLIGREIRAMGLARNSVDLIKGRKDTNGNAR